MPRKSITGFSPKSIDRMTEDAIEEFKAVSEMKFELAKDAYERQDSETKATIDRIVSTLRQYATGYINIQLNPPEGALVPVKLDNEYLGYNLYWLAVEIVKDCAFIGIRIANFEFPDTYCAQCGRELIPEKRSGRKAGRG